VHTLLLQLRLRATGYWLARSSDTRFASIAQITAVHCRSTQSNHHHHHHHYHHGSLAGEHCHVVALLCNKVKYKVKRVLAVCNQPHHRYGNSHACHMRSHSVTCQLAEVTFPPAPERIKTGTRFSDPLQRDARLSLPSWLGYIRRWYIRPKTVTHHSTDRAQRTATSFMRRTTLSRQRVTAGLHAAVTYPVDRWGSSLS